MTWTLTPAAAPVVLLLSLSTQQGVDNIVLAMIGRDVVKPAFSNRYAPFPRFSADEVVSAITEVIEQEQPIPHLVGAVSGYNIVLFAGIHYAVPQSLGALDLSQLDLASRPPEILIGRSYDEVVLAISAVIKQEAIKEQPTST